MKIELPSLNDIKRHESNPFIIEPNDRVLLQPGINTIVARGEKIIDAETREIIKEDNVLIGRQKLVDKSQFDKIYALEIGTLFDLSKVAINIFLHLSKIMYYDNKAYFNYVRDHKKSGYKTHIIPLKAIRELISKNIIARSYITHFWWLNPLLFCERERFVKYTEYVVCDVSDL